MKCEKVGIREVVCTQCGQKNTSEVWNHNFPRTGTFTYFNCSQCNPHGTPQKIEVIMIDESTARLI
jgi:hypothetical protein